VLGETGTAFSLQAAPAAAIATSKANQNVFGDLVITFILLVDRLQGLDP